MNQYESVLAAARQAALDHAHATAQARHERRQAFETEMEPVLRAEKRRKGKDDDDKWDEWESRSNQTA